MKLEIKYIVDHGHDTERIVISVLEDADLDHYMICDITKRPDGKISNKLRHQYWFYKQEVKAGDLVVLYTRKGNNSTYENKDGSISYFYYWNLDSNVWNDDGDMAFLIHTPAWQVYKPKI